MAKINIICAASLNGVIGDGKTNNLPWSLDEFPEDMKHFMEATKGSTIIMGSKTMHSIGRALPKRRNIVISRSKNLVKPDPSIEQFSNLQEAIATCQKEETAWIIGGAQIYQMALPIVDELWITTIPKVIEGEGLIYFPYLNHREYYWEKEIVINAEKKLCCDVFMRDKWPETSLTKGERIAMGLKEV
jgi:dihydrofolate reductase